MYKILSQEAQDFVTNFTSLVWFKVFKLWLLFLITIYIIVIVL